MDQKRTPKIKVSLKTLFNDIIPDLNFLDKYWQIILTLTLCTVLAVFVFWKLIRRSSKKDAVAIIGLSGSGKTQLFSQLCYGVDVLSVTSVKESKGYFTLNNSEKVLMYDLPGHDRIRYTIFEKVKQQLRSLLFILDASTVQEDIKDVAECLYTIFCDGSIQSSRLQVLIVCNKQDIPSAKGSTLLKSSLEKEINLLRVTKSHGLQSVGENTNNNLFLGIHGRDFEFSHLKMIKVSFAESVATKGTQIKEVKAWLNSVM